MLPAILTPTFGDWKG